VAGMEDWASAKTAMQRIPYLEAFVKVDSGLDLIFSSQQLHDWPQSKNLTSSSSSCEILCRKGWCDIA